MNRYLYKSSNNARSQYNWPLNFSSLSGLMPLALIVVCLTRALFDTAAKKERHTGDHWRNWMFLLPRAFYLFCPSIKKQWELWWLTIIAQHHDTPAKFLTWLAVSRLGRGSVSQPSGILMWICTSLCKKQRIKNNWCNILNWTGNVSEALGILVSLFPCYPSQ